MRNYKRGRGGEISGLELEVCFCSLAVRQGPIRPGDRVRNAACFDLLSPLLPGGRAIISTPYTRGFGEPKEERAAVWCIRGPPPPPPPRLVFLPDGSKTNGTEGKEGRKKGGGE